MKKLTILLIIPIILCGCATVNFSSKYYTLPVDYKKDIDEVWNEIILKVPLKYKNSYSYKITKDHETSISGVPQIFDYTVSLPESFLKYIYRYYYNDRATIITCVIFHELAHQEFNLGVGNPKQHYLVDKAAIEHFIINNNLFFYTISDYRSSLGVTWQYMDSRKGFLNVLNYTSIFLIGIGEINDFLERMILLHKDYPQAKYIFKRSSYQRTIK